MNIAGTEFNLKHCAYEIYVAGCTLGCIGCHNSVLKDFNYGRPWKEVITTIIKEASQPIVKQIWILGGEPQDQDREEFISFMEEISKLQASKILFTGVDYVDESLIKYFDFIKLGAFWSDYEAYVEPVLGLTLASPNQHVITQKTAKEMYAVYYS